MPWVMMMDVNVNPTVVIDCSSYMYSGGFSGDDAPKECLPTIVETSVEPTGCRHMNHIRHGIVTDWYGMEKVRLVIIVQLAVIMPFSFGLPCLMLCM